MIKVMTLNRQERTDQPGVPQKTTGDYKRGMQPYKAGKPDAGQKTGMRGKQG